MTTRNPPRRIEAVEKTSEIIAALRKLDGAGVTELARHLDLPKTTVHAHLSTLESESLLVNDGGHYRLGLMFLSFGEYVKQQQALLSIVPDQIDQLSEQTSGVAEFVVEEHGHAVYLYKATSKQSVQTKSEVGGRGSLHRRAVGKVILANLPEERVEEIVDTHGLERYTEHTITDRDELREELETIRNRGYAIDDEEYQLGLRGVAAPVLDESGDVLGGVGVTGAVGRFNDDALHEDISRQVRNTANVVEVNARNRR